MSDTLFPRGRFFWYILGRNEMNAPMPRPSFDLRDPDVPRRWEGLAEIDQAVRDNRVMEYRAEKAWADPWGRKLTIFVMVVIVAGFSYLAGASFGFW